MTNSNNTIEMRLKNKPFEKIKNGTKQIELRLFDEKRSLIKLEDVISFSDVDNPNNTLEVKVIGLSKFSSFENLVKCLDPLKCGWDKILDSKTMTEQMREYYSVEEEQQYGVIGIHFELIS